MRVNFRVLTLKYDLKNTHVRAKGALILSRFRFIRKNYILDGERGAYSLNCQLKTGCISHKRDWLYGRDREDSREDNKTR